MKQHPLKGWRKIGALVGGGAICTLYPPAAAFVLPLVKVYLLAQGGVDLAEKLATGKQWDALAQLTQDQGLQLTPKPEKAGGRSD